MDILTPCWLKNKNFQFRADRSFSKDPDQYSLWLPSVVTLKTETDKEDEYFLTITCILEDFFHEEQVLIT